MYSIYRDGTRTGRKAKNGTFISEHRVENPELIEGRLYRVLFSGNRADIDIGEYDGNRFCTALRVIKPEYLYEEVDPTDLYVRLLSPDGKQKGRELIEENIERSFKIKDVGPHDKYKYIIEIDGEDVAVSAGNVIFHGEPLKQLEKGTVVKCSGVKGLVQSTDYHPPYDRYLIRDLNSGKSFYTKVVDEIITVVKSALMTNRMFDEVKDKVEIVDTNRGFVSGARYLNTKFGFGVLEADEMADFQGIRCYVDDENLEKMKEIFSPRFIYKNKVFVINNKFRKKVLHKPRKNRYRNRPERARMRMPRIDMFENEAQYNG